METIRIVRGYKTELDLNDRQRTACAKHAGAARYAYNWGLRRKIEAYEATGKSPTAIDLHRELNALKKTALGWMYEVSKCAPQEALRDLDQAFAHFFRRVRLKQQGKLNEPLGFPRFKSRKAGLGSFRMTGSVHVFEDSVQLPRLGRLRLKNAGTCQILTSRSCRRRFRSGRGVGSSASRWRKRSPIQHQRSVSQWASIWV